MAQPQPVIELWKFEFTSRILPSSTTMPSSSFVPLNATAILARRSRASTRVSVSRNCSSARFLAKAPRVTLQVPSRAPAPPTQQRRRLSNYRPLRSMASDEDYMAFLAKANRDVDESRAAAASQSQDQPPQFKALDEGGQVPRVIVDAIADAVYVSDADEPFCGVSLKWSGEGLPDEESFATLIHHWDPAHAEIEILDPADWDAREQYGKIVDAVRDATRGNDVRVYRVPRDRRSRVEYWVVSRDDETKSVVGVKALGVES